MEDPRETLRITTVVEVTAETLATIVANAKAVAGADDRGRYQVDTADKVGELITRFLFEKDFESYVADIDKYRD